MAFKFVIFAAFIAVAKAGGLIGAPVAATYAAAPFAYHSAPLIHSGPALHAAPIAAAPIYRSAPLLHSAPVAYSAPIAKVATPVVAKAVVSEEYDPNPQYSYGYDVQDSLTGDSKSQVESRNGDVVQGSYSLVDPDGTKRTVEYTADPINGFNAVVHKEPLVQKAIVAAPAVAKVATPVAIAHAPVAKLAAPLAYSAHVLH